MPTGPLREPFRCRGPRRAKPPKKRQNRVLGGKTNVIQVTTRVSDGLMYVDYQWDRNGACGYTQWRILAPISSRIRRIQPPLEARVWAKSRAGGRFAGGWRRHRYVGPLVYASQLAQSISILNTELATAADLQ